jgi:hypothetical protein
MNFIWMPAIRRAAGLTAAAGAAALLLACTTMGTGTGSLSPGDQPVAFSWTSTDGGITGTMTATVDGTAQFAGPFLQVTSKVKSEDLGPMWNGWDAGWSGWGGWGAWGEFPEDVFATNYSGKVLATLAGANNVQLRCRFHLNDPVAGMGGGGMGECKFAGGRTVSAVFARS